MKLQHGVSAKLKEAAERAGVKAGSYSTSSKSQEKAERDVKKLRNELNVRSN